MVSTTIRRFHPGDEEGMNAVIRRAFKNPSSNAYPLPPDRFIILAEIDGEVVGHVSVRPMMFHFNDGIVRGNVLHMVATDPGYQHRGIGLHMLDAVRKVSVEETMPVSVLETPFPGFYALRGWVPLAPRENIVVSRAAVAGVEPCHVALGEVSEAHVRELATWHGRLCSEVRLTAVANEPYMALLVKRSSGVVSFFHEIRKPGRLAGFVRGERGGFVQAGEPLAITVKEWIMDQPEADEVAEVIAGLLAFDDEFDRVDVQMPVAPAIEQALLVAGGVRVPRGGNVDMAILPPGCGVEPATITPRYESSLFAAHLEAMGLLE